MIRNPKSSSSRLTADLAIYMYTSSMQCAICNVHLGLKHPLALKEKCAMLLSFAAVGQRFEKSENTGAGCLALQAQEKCRRSPLPETFRETLARLSTNENRVPGGHLYAYSERVLVHTVQPIGFFCIQVDSGYPPSQLDRGKVMQ